MRMMESVAELAESHDGYVLDIWGVIHDGQQPYPGVPEALAEMRARGKRIVLLSNAPRRAWTVEKQLAGMGLDKGLWDGIVTSGEVSWTLLRDRTHPWFAKLGRRAFHLGPERDLSVVEDLDISLVATPAEADWLLNTGPDPLNGARSADPYQPLLEDCARHKLPMLCVNPDRAVMVGGERLICAGAFADRYLELGGDVMEIGKPDAMVYETVLATLGVPASRVAAIGDTPHTDLLGAKNAGIDAVWAMTGLAADNLGPDPSDALLEAEAARQHVSPIAALRSLRWAA
ncbi:TIGR01459 family HAD-type hydrolase [Pseudoroseomonas ludipueritiae]|uniref:TIGR01459 family HAD-type hydrolase n=1 Tax=Pseudoroseomonas ludipueritiae TaxID=198093 RepID=A0ABR7R3W5_9PROT|nr:TIGR01459 family HAD-type hydrolase [Pseudoroseomonas ludipueritiae]MBC9176310.1 TIGR01459 family HAD-type hydrolase [Pseudoroseomonas ludipueritiae]MCG7362216.1 TIGR01459 family HAD-type hydrolase [Roseomonas sp. ACRSG]